MKQPTLPFIPFTLPNESPISALQRAAKVNGFKNVYGLISYLCRISDKSGPRNYLLTNSRISQALQSCTHEHTERVQANFYSPVNRLTTRPDIFVKGVKIKYHNFRSSETALCTDCLEEGYEKFPRDIKLFFNCPFHHCAFLLACPTCGVSLNWKTQLTTICTCGAQLKSPEAPSSEIAEDCYLLELFNQGDNEKIASIQRTLRKLRLETFTSDDPVRRARRTLAIALVRQDVMMVKNAIHGCLPSSTIDEIDITLTLLGSDLSDDMIADLRQQLIESATAQGTPPVQFCLNMATLKKYIGIPRSAWHPFREFKKLSKKLGAAFKASLEDAISLKSAAILALNLEDRSPLKFRNGHSKHYVSIGVVQNLTRLPETAIIDLALRSNLLGPKSRHIFRRAHGEELLFEKSTVTALNHKIVSSHLLSHKWGIPLPQVEQVILSHNYQLKQYSHLNGTLLISPNLTIKLFKALNNASSPTKPKHLTVPKLPPSKARNYLTCKECSSALGVSTCVTKFLIANGVLPCHAKSRDRKYLIAKTDLQKFRKNHLFVSDLGKRTNMSPRKITQLLANSGVMPISGPFVDGGRTNIYAKTSFLYSIIRGFKQRSRITARRRSVLDNPEGDLVYCIHINSICMKFSISKYQFYHYFFASNLFTHKTYRSEKYITALDSEKICRILKKYVPIIQAAEMLNINPSLITTLIINNQLLLNHEPFQPKRNPGLISRDQIDELRRSLAKQ